LPRFFSPGLILACLALVAGAVLLWSGPVQAHKVKVFASAEGPVIAGYAYFPGGGRVKDGRVDIFGPDGQNLGQVMTNERGEFSFQAQARVDHLLVLDAGQGHVARFLVEAEELPESLARGGGAKTPSPPAQKQAAAPEDTAPSPGQAGISEGRLTELMDQAVSRQIRPLRRQIEAFQEKIFWHDVLGGIGYIIGLMGLSFYFLGRRRSKGR